ncbi:MAG: dihydroneopterin aldolase [Burkholderiales bacterium]|nr:dihydroneopterin aldolase [Burkholderiales bacterium]
MDLIFIRQLAISTIVGHYPREREAAQSLEFNIDIGIPGAGVFDSDRLADTVNYAAVADYVKRECDTHHFKLLERMADHLARGILREFHAPFVRISVAKLGILPAARQVGVVVERHSTGA